LKTQNRFLISKATVKNVPDLCLLVNSAYRGESSKKGWTTEANLLKGDRITKDELLKIFQQKGNTILKCTDNNQIVGCVLLVEKKSELYLGMLTVAPEMQNSGIGKTLLFEAETHALKLNSPKIVMTVISIRQELIAWYNRHGYIATGTKTPFPIADSDTILINQPLDFIILEKNI
jgi:ribosomal protein S18 acetylase RimI-like enzyme